MAMDSLYEVINQVDLNAQASLDSKQDAGAKQLRDWEVIFVTMRLAEELSEVIAVAHTIRDSARLSNDLFLECGQALGVYDYLLKLIDPQDPLPDAFEWPPAGDILGAMIESCASAIKRASKVVRFSAEHRYHGYTASNIERLAREMGILRNLLELACKRWHFPHKHVSEEQRLVVSRLINEMKWAPKGIKC